MLGDEPPIRNNFYSPKPEELFTAPNDADSTKEPSQASLDCFIANWRISGGCVSDGSI